MRNVIKVLLIGIVTFSMCSVISPKDVNAMIAFGGKADGEPYDNYSWFHNEHWGSAQDEVFDEVKDELNEEEDKALDEFNNKLMDLITEFISNYNNENFDPQQLQQQLTEIRENYQAKLNKVDKKQNFLQDIKGMSQKELENKRDSIMSKHNENFNILKGYMDADNKEKFVAKKMEQFNNERKKARNEMDEQIDSLISSYVEENKALDSEFMQEYQEIKKEYNNKLDSIMEKENFLHKVESMSNSELQEKIDDMISNSSSSVEGDIVQWKLDVLSQFESKYKSDKYNRWEHRDYGDSNFLRNPDVRSSYSSYRLMGK